MELLDLFYILHHSSPSPDCALCADTRLLLLLRIIMQNIPALSIMTGSLYSHVTLKDLQGTNCHTKGRELQCPVGSRIYCVNTFFSVRNGMWDKTWSLKNGASSFFHALLNSRVLSLSTGASFCITSLFYLAHLPTQSHMQSKAAKLAFNKTRKVH